VREGSVLRPADNPVLLEAVLARMAGLVWTADTTLRCGFVGGDAAARVSLAAGDDIAESTFATEGVAAHRRALCGEAARFEWPAGETLFACVVEPLRDADGSIIGVLGNASDITEPRRTAQSLANLRSIFETTLDAAPDGIAICDAQGRFVYVNRAAHALAEAERAGAAATAGTSLGEDGETVWGRWYHDGDLVPVDQWPMARALRGELVVAQEGYKQYPDGTRHHFQVGASPVRDADGRVIGAVAITTDVSAGKETQEYVQALNEALEQRVRERTAHELEREIVERRQANVRLARSEQMLSDVIKHSPAVVYLKDLAGRYMLINRPYWQLFSDTSIDVSAQSDANFFPPQIAATLRANDERVLASEASMEFEEVLPIGGAERTYLSVKFPLRDSFGDVYAVCGISTDITERTRVQAELHRSQATLAAVIESISDPICAVDRNLHIVAFNGVLQQLLQTMFGKAPRVGSPRDLAPPADLVERWTLRFRRALEGERFDAEEVLTIDGAARHFLVSLNPTLQDGAVTGVTVFGKEITELRRAEAQARQHQAELAHMLRLHTMGELAASLAHEVNQPLGAIANYAQGARLRLETGTAEPSELLNSLTEIAREALRAGEIRPAAQGEQSA